MQFFLPERWGLQTNNNKNAGHDMAIVGEPCNADVHALFMPMMCPRLRNMSSSVCASSMPSRLCLKMSSFMHLCACTYTCFYDCKFYFWLRLLIAITVQAQLCFDCQGEESAPNVVFHRRSSSNKGCPPPKVVFH